jgi:hypothetical protein
VCHILENDEASERIERAKKRGLLDIFNGILLLTPNFSWVKYRFVPWNRFSGFPSDGKASCLLAKAARQTAEAVLPAAAENHPTEVGC